MRRDASGLIVPLRPGRQDIELVWKSNEPMDFTADTGQVTLPVAGSNVSTVMQVPDSRWVLWANGPLRGPAVRFWTILVTAVLIALVLGALPNSPLEPSRVGIAGDWTYAGSRGSGIHRRHLVIRAGHAW